MSWQDRAACAVMDPALFFPVGRLDSDAPVAIAACNGCAVRMQCLDFALTTNQEHGVWGGMNEVTRRRLRRKKQRQSWPSEARA